MHSWHQLCERELSAASCVNSIASTSNFGDKDCCAETCPYLLYHSTLPCHCCASLRTLARCSAQVRACGNLRCSHSHLLCLIGLPGVPLGSDTFVPLVIILGLQASMGVYCHNK